MASTTTAVEHIHDEVRELIRRRGLDPVADRRAARLLIDEVVGHYEERVATSALPPLLDPEGVTRFVFDSLAGFGPLQRFLDDPQIEEIWVNGPGRVFVARDGTSELTTTVLAPGEVRDLVERMLKPSGRRLDLSSPFVDALLPDGSRLHAVIPDITREHLSLNIRKFVVAANGLEDLVSRGTITPHAARFLEAAVVAGLNIIVAGGTQAGKTTLLNTLINSIPARERVITCEEVFELRPNLPDVVAMQTRQPNLEGHGEIRLRRLVKEALRMRPSRMVVGEVRQEESLDLLIALNSGLPGSLSTLQPLLESGAPALVPEPSSVLDLRRAAIGIGGLRTASFLPLSSVVASGDRQPSEGESQKFSARKMSCEQSSQGQELAGPHERNKEHQCLGREWHSRQNGWRTSAGIAASVSGSQPPRSASNESRFSELLTGKTRPGNRLIGSILANVGGTFDP